MAVKKPKNTTEDLSGSKGLKDEKLKPKKNLKPIL